MKLDIKNIGIVLALITSTQVIAQQKEHDASYSIHNYKHPNKAAIAQRQLEARPVVFYAEIKNQNQEIIPTQFAGNYKVLNPDNTGIRNFVVSATPSFYVLPEQNRNYKQQFKPNSNKTTPVQPVDENVPVARK